MNEKEIMEKLKQEGFRNVFTHTDSPGAVHPEHTHNNLTCHVVIDGEIEITSGGKTRKYKKGERFDVPPGEAHSAVVGDSGCTYILGEK